MQQVKILQGTNMSELETAVNSWLMSTVDAVTVDSVHQSESAIVPVGGNKAERSITVLIFHTLIPAGGGATGRGTPDKGGKSDKDDDDDKGKGKSRR